MKLHVPLFKAVFATIVPYITMTTFENFFIIKSSHSLLEFVLWFLAGYFYTNFFEWWYHNYWLHKWRTSLRIGHAYHHAKLHGKHFRTRDTERLQATTTSWYIFPILFTVHYFGFIAVFGHQNTIAFFSGITFHFTICYEISHWLTHVSDTMIDKILNKIPLINSLRARQIEHHRIHHVEYLTNFNFSPPYIGDMIFKTKK